MGGAMMPSMAAAYALLEPRQVPRATSQLNVLQRIGGSIGTAVLAVVLQHELAGAARRGTPAALADAFGHTFWWAVGASLLALVPATVLALSQRGDAAGDARPAIAEAA
jgi:hypothetical protein